MTATKPMPPVLEPGINTQEARWAAEAVASLARQLDSDSLVGMVLRQSHRELMSLTATNTESTVIGPIRVRAA